MKRTSVGESDAAKRWAPAAKGLQSWARRLVIVLALGVAIDAVVVDAGRGAHATTRTSLGLFNSTLTAGTPRKGKRPCRPRGCRGYDPSGQPPPKRHLPGWRRVFVDDFRSRIRLGGFGRDRRWTAYPYPARDTSQQGTYWPQRGLSMHDGVLDIRLYTATADGRVVHVVNAPQPRLPNVERGQLYGRYAIRFKADPVTGYKTAWLLWPDSGDRAEGEIDFPETYSLHEGTIHAFVHPNNGTRQAAFDTGVPEAGAWHTAVIVWTPGLCRFILDGKQIGSTTNGIPDTPMHWVIQTETQLSGGPPPDKASGHVYIDWVAVYARA